MTISVAIRELEKIGAVRQSDRGYRMDYVVVAAQEEIKTAFRMMMANVGVQATVIKEDLMKIRETG